MMQFLTELANFLGADRYEARSACLTGDPIILTLYVWGDTMTALSLFTIAGMLLFRKAMPSTRRPILKEMFGIFIGLAALSYTVKLITLFSGIYRLDVGIVFAIGAVSAVTAITLIQDALSERA